MARAFTQLAFSSAVKAAQARYGAREDGERLEQKDPPRDRLNDVFATAAHDPELPQEIANLTIASTWMPAQSTSGNAVSC
jgi:hypothetical protein